MSLGGDEEQDAQARLRGDATVRPCVLAMVSMHRCYCNLHAISGSLALWGVPANTWTRTEVLLHGLGIVVKVAASTISRSDMAGFKVWLRTDDPAHIPS